MFFTIEQEVLLKSFADLSDQLFNLGVISTDSFTGEIGEYFACKAFDLKKSKRVTKAVDGLSKTGEKYQVKAKVANSSFNYHIKRLNTKLFDYLVIVYFDTQYNPTKIIRIPAKHISNNEISITITNINSFEHVEIDKIIIPASTKTAINNFARVYQELERSGIIRSRRIVGDIGEFYACRRLNLTLSENRNEKGLDARHENGLTFEIKTRRVYESGRRISETRRLNNLVGKNADFLIVVTIDRVFKCSGMWLIPMKNIENHKSAKLEIVNNTIGTRNLIPSKIKWLKTGIKFTTFNNITVSKNSKTAAKRSLKARIKSNQYEIDDLDIINQEIRRKTKLKKTHNSNLKVPEPKRDTWGCIFYIVLVLLSIYLIGVLLESY